MMNTPSPKPSKQLSALTKAPKVKIHWALKLLQDKGHVLGRLVSTKVGPSEYEIDGKVITVQQVYKLASKYREWNDRLGLGTALIPKVSMKNN